MRDQHDTEPPHRRQSNYPGPEPTPPPVVDESSDPTTDPSDANSDAMTHSDEDAGDALVAEAEAEVEEDPANSDEGRVPLPPRTVGVSLTVLSVASFALAGGMLLIADSHGLHHTPLLVWAVFTFLILAPFAAVFGAAWTMGMFGAAAAAAASHQGSSHDESGQER